MVPDLKATSLAIENHGDEHRKREKDQAKADAEENRIKGRFNHTGVEEGK
jgi:hypothetical protein